MLSLLSMNHSQRELKSLFSCSSIVLVSFAVYIRQVSSAYNNSSELTACGISFTYKRKSNGPRIEPSGTPQDNLPGEEYFLPTFTINDLLVRYELNQSIVDVEKPRYFILSRRMPRSIVSKAFCRSIKTIPVSNPSSKPVWTLLVKLKLKLNLNLKLKLKLNLKLKLRLNLNLNL